MSEIGCQSCSRELAQPIFQENNQTAQKKQKRRRSKRSQDEDGEGNITAGVRLER